LTNQRLVFLNRVALSERQAERIKEGRITDSSENRKTWPFSAVGCEQLLMTVWVEKIVKKFMVVRTPAQKFRKKEVLPPWLRAKKMKSQPCWGLKITFDEGRNCSQGLKIPFKRITSLLEKCDQGCVHNLGLTTPENWLLSILITLFPV